MKKKPFDARKKDTTTVGDAIKELLNTYKIKSKYHQTNITASWGKLMGNTIASRTEKIFFKNHVLFVQLSSAALKHELNMSKSKASPLVLGPSSPVFPGPFKKNLSALFRMNGEKVQFTQMKHAWAHMVQVKYRGKDGRETDLKLHFYTEILASEYDNIESAECRIIGMPHALHQSVFSDCRCIRCSSRSL